ncbi:hypothetical protein [Mycobacterium sp. URHB0021]|jgi:hypothetical protein
MGEVILGGEAVAAGVVTRHELRCSYQTIHRGVYVRKDADVSFRDRAVAAWLASRRKGVVAGAAAAALHGAAWVDPAQPIEVAGVKCAAQKGLVFRAERIADDEIIHLAGLPVTTRTRTAFDVGRRPDRYQSLARLDALMWNQHFSIDEVTALAQRYPRATGVRQLQDLLPLVDAGAATPRQSRIRLCLLDNGFPRPLTQVAVLVGSRPVAFLDMGWPEFMVAVEDGGDVARIRMLEAMGWIVIRVLADDRPVEWLAKVEAALVARGCVVELADAA